MLCDADGIVREVICETAALDRPPLVGIPLATILAPDNETKLAALLDELKQTGTVFEWSLNVDTRHGAMVFRFDGVSAREGYIIMAASNDDETDEVIGQVVSMNSDLVNAVRRLQQRTAAVGLTLEAEEGRRKHAETELEGREAQLEELLEEREQHLARLAQALASIIEVVGEVVEMRDPYTAGHQRRVAELAEQICVELGLSAEETEEIRIASLIHDVGKISVPSEILTKPGRLSTAEFEFIQGHSEAGYRIISSANMEGTAAEIIYQHHERCDGSGYPRALSSKDLLLGSRVVMVADVVEAMTSHRPYRPGLGIEAGLAEIEHGAGVLYDAEICEACLTLFRDKGFAFSEA